MTNNSGCAEISPLPDSESASAAVRRGLHRSVRAAFFFSGLSALFYQIIWLRQLATVFGNTTLAISVTLTAFMTGLAAGSYLLGRLGDRVARPFRVYAWLEILIGIYGIASLPLLHAVHAGYVALAGRLPFDSPWLVSFQFWASFLVLVTPTALMGGTLPVASKGLVGRLDAIGEEVGKLYGINTFGAAFGVLLAGFFLLPLLGLRGAVLIAAAANLMVGAVIWRADARAPALESRAVPEERAALASVPSQPDAASAIPALLSVILVIGFGLSGFAGLALEVAWARALSLYIGSSVYAFSAILLAVLIGIAIGSVLVARRAAESQITTEWFAAAQLGAGGSTLALVLAYNGLAFSFFGLVRRLGGNYVLLLSAEVIAIVGCLLLPTLFSGATFPIASRIYVRQSSALSRALGFLYAANTLGCILGAFAAGFLLIPWLGLRGTVLLCAGLYIVTAAAVLLSGVGWRRLLGAASLAAFVAALVFLPRWRPELMSAGFFRNRPHLKAVQAAVLHDRKILFYREGSLATVTVTEQNGVRSLLVNGKADASEWQGDMDTQRLLAHLPLLLANREQSVLVIGLGSGTSAGTAALYPVRRIECIEIEPVVAQAARYFDRVNHDVFRDPRFRLIEADARNYLEATRRRYDVIISEPSNPWVAGVASLFTIEHFQALRSRLNDGGIICQWVQIYEMSSHDLASIIATFVRVFPDATLWWTGRDSTDIALIAQKRPWKIDYPRVARRMGELPEVRADLKRTSLDSPLAVLSYLALGPMDLNRVAGGGDLNTDNLPRIEFSAPRSLYATDAADRNRVMLAKRKAQLFDQIVNLGAPGRSADTRKGLADELRRRYDEATRKLFYLPWMQEQLAAAIALAPQRAGLYEELARVQIAMGDQRGARASIGKALALEPGRQSARKLLTTIGSE
jgi:spermidine synthase